MKASNIKAMREALEIAEYVLCAKGLFDVSKQMTAAISAPPRNCDRPECATTKDCIHKKTIELVAKAREVIGGAE